MKINKKKFVYIISPNTLTKNFYKNLKTLLNTNRVLYFQMRFKKYSYKRKIIIGNKIKQICKKNHVKFIVNDDPILAKRLNADGCHLGQNDMNIKDARKIIGNKIIGITCHNSLKLAKIALREKPSYLAFGAFFPSQTKEVKFKANIRIIKQVKKLTKIPIVAIGGINSKNYKKLLLNNVNFLAISGYIWKNKKYKPLKALERFE